jgi:hypothetical protein
LRVLHQTKFPDLLRKLRNLTFFESLSSGLQLFLQMEFLFRAAEILIGHFYLLLELYKPGRPQNF